MLGVARDATEADIKRAYRRLALVWHPDVRPEDPSASGRFRALADAYAVIGHDDNRARYDASLASPESPRVVSGSAEMTSTLGGLLDGWFGIRDRRPRRGRDRKYVLAVSVPEIARGAPKALTLPRRVDCSRCDSRGFEPGSVPLICETCAGAGALIVRRALRSSVDECSDCGGRGYTAPVPCTECSAAGEVMERQSVTVDIPAGTKDGKVLVLRGLGEEGRHGGRNGDCFVHVEVRAHPFLRREGQHLRVERPVSVLTAMIGGKIGVPTFNGQAKIVLPAGSPDGRVLRLRGYGVRDPKTGQTGDQLVTIRLEMPSSLDEPHREALQMAAEVLGAGVFPKTDAFDRILGGPGDGSNERGSA